MPIQQALKIKGNFYVAHAGLSGFVDSGVEVLPQIDALSRQVRMPQIADEECALFGTYPKTAHIRKRLTILGLVTNAALSWTKPPASPTNAPIMLLQTEGLPSLSASRTVPLLAPHSMNPLTTLSVSRAIPLLVPSSPHPMDPRMTLSASTVQ
ncbi:hypothetical protein F5887DRAFT_1159516 [Amanita rubescens]|nr:hypothetical protein F5887DRAFT_1159516 [Amanita rubescens]